MIEEHKLEQNQEQQNTTHDTREAVLLLQKNLTGMAQEDAIQIVNKIEQAQNKQWIQWIDKLKSQVEQITEICNETWVDAETLKDFFLLPQEDIDAIFKEPKWKLEDAIVDHQILMRKRQKAKEEADKAKEEADKLAKEELDRQKAADKAKEEADKAKEEASKIQLNENLQKQETEKQKHIETLKNTNNKILASLQKTPLNLSDEQLASVKTTLSEDGKKKLVEQWITDPEKTYKQYVYALQNPDQMPADMKNILAGQDPQELLAQFNADYWAQALAEKTVDRRTYAKWDPDRKMDGSVTMPNDRPRNKVSFRGAFAAFERQYFDPENKLQKLLNTSMNTHLGEEWMRKEEAGTKWPKTLQDGLEDISLTYLQQQTLNFQEFGRKDIQYLLQWVVKEDKMKQTGAAIIKFTKACKENPNLFMVLQNTPLNKLTEEQKQMKTNMIVLNRIIQQRFLKETQHVAKKTSCWNVFWADCWCNGCMRWKYYYGHRYGCCDVWW